MPGMYRKGEYDLAGCIVGVVDRAEMIDGSKIKPAMSSSAFRPMACTPTAIRSRARSFRENEAQAVVAKFAGSKQSLGDELLARAQELSAAAREVPARNDSRPCAHHRRRTDR